MVNMEQCVIDPSENDAVDFDAQRLKMQEDLQINLDFMEKLRFACVDVEGVMKTLQTKLQKEQSTTAEVSDRMRETTDKLGHLQNEVDQIYQLIDLKMQEATNLEDQIKDTFGPLKSKLDEQDSELDRLRQVINYQKGRVNSLSYLKAHIESYYVGFNYLQDPVGACVLPDDSVVIIDAVEGLLLFNSDIELEKQTPMDDSWKNPTSVAYCSSTKQIFVTVTTVKSGKSISAVGVFSPELNLSETVDYPLTGTGFKRITKTNIAVDKEGRFLFLTLCDTMDSAGLWRYELEQHNWEEITRRANSNYSFMQILNPSELVAVDAQVRSLSRGRGGGPTQDVFVVESNMGYLQRLTVQDRNIIDRRSIAVVPKPGPMAIDETSKIFLQNLDDGKIFQLDHYRYEIKREICLSEEEVYDLSAMHGSLCVTLRNAKLVRIFRFADASGSLVSIAE